MSALKSWFHVSRRLSSRDPLSAPTDWKAYVSLPARGFVHQARIQRGADQPPHVLLPGPHRVVSLLKRWLLGTHQGAVGLSHIGYSLDEFTYRFNRRSSRSRGLLFFFRLLEQAVQLAQNARRATLVTVVPNGSRADATSADTRAHLEALRQRLGRRADVCAISHERASDAIAACVGQVRGSLTVVGRRGRGGRSVIGSTVENLSRKVAAPMLVVP